MAKGWTGKILDIDLSNMKITTKDTLPYTELFIGGRGINVKILFDEIDFSIDPFDPGNILAIGPGALAGTPAPCSSRSTITAISPRGLIDSSNIGGFIGAEIKFAGYDHIFISGKAEEPAYVYVSDDVVKIEDARHLWGKDPWMTQQLIRKELGDRDIQCMSIGQAGENQVHFACIMTGRLTSAAGRCGLGAIMGAKNLKTVAVRGKGSIAVAEPDQYLATALEINKKIRESHFFEGRRGCFDDKLIYKRYKESGKMVIGNWEDANWIEDGFEKLLEDPEEFWQKKAQHLQSKGSQQPGCFGCPVYHETFFEIPEVGDMGRTKCEEWLSMGSSVWINDRREVNEAAYLCNQYGMDVVSLGNCISFLMELHQRGIISDKDTDGIPMKRGDMAAVRSAVLKIGSQQGFGRLFKKGVAEAAKLIGGGAEACAMQIKGLELFAEEFRAYKSMALLAAVGKTEHYSTIDYTWYNNPEKMERLAIQSFGRKDAAIPNVYEDKACLVVTSENEYYASDILGVCTSFVPRSLTQSINEFATLLSLATGSSYSEDDILEAAQRVLLLERSFNATRGITRKDEKPPIRFFEATVPDGKYKGEILHEDRFEMMLSDYYKLRGCTKEGLPKIDTFKALKLTKEANKFKKCLNT
jgi:aldehyde:ferredoxin oxidoreductase